MNWLSAPLPEVCSQNASPDALQVQTNESSPEGIESTSCNELAGSEPVLATRTVYCTVPPGSSCVRSAVLLMLTRAGWEGWTGRVDSAWQERGSQTTPPSVTNDATFETAPLASGDTTASMTYVRVPPGLNTSMNSFSAPVPEVWKQNASPAALHVHAHDSSPDGMGSVSATLLHDWPPVLAATTVYCTVPPGSS